MLWQQHCDSCKLNVFETADFDVLTAGLLFGSLLTKITRIAHHCDHFRTSGTARPCSLYCIRLL